MPDPTEIERAARRIIDDVSREFPGVSMQLDFDTPRDDHEDACLWINAGTDDAEDIKEIWGYVIKLVQDAYNDEDIYLVARMKGAGVIVRERPSDVDF
jgi:hypothetical protein